MIKRLYLILFLLLVGAAPAAAEMPSQHFEITQVYPNAEVILALKEPIYLRISYDSSVPIRFQASARSEGDAREVGAVPGRAQLYPSGKGEALITISFDNPTHIDEVVVTAYDGAWERLGETRLSFDMHWSGVQTLSQQPPAPWIGLLEKKSRLRADYLFDPDPKPPTPVSDAIVLLALLSIPLYFFLQVRMLSRYRHRWREMATAPLITLLPMFIYAFWVGIGYDLRLWPPFLIYYVLFSTGYLVAIWVVKRIRS